MGLAVAEKRRQRGEDIEKEREGQRKDIPTKPWVIATIVRLQNGSKGTGEERRRASPYKRVHSKGKKCTAERQKWRYHKSISPNSLQCP